MTFAYQMLGSSTRPVRPSRHAKRGVELAAARDRPKRLGAKAKVKLQQTSATDWGFSDGASSWGWLPVAGASPSLELGTGEAFFRTAARRQMSAAREVRILLLIGPERSLPGEPRPEDISMNAFLDKRNYLAELEAFEEPLAPLQASRGKARRARPPTSAGGRDRGSWPVSRRTARPPSGRRRG